jgi:SAM-dependent methyltransferase
MMAATAPTHERAAWRLLIGRAAEPFHAGGRFAWKFALGKLFIDPVFRHMLRRGLIPPNARVVDIGCGQGILTSLLRAVDSAPWPATWAPPPIHARVTGIELMARDVERARAALGPREHFVCGDMRTTPFPDCDIVVILDVLHYVSHAEQDEILNRVLAALSPGGRLLLRVGDAGAASRFAISQWVDHIVTRVRGHRVPPCFGRPLAAWIATLQARGFVVQAQPMSGSMPFANVLLVCELSSMSAGQGPRRGPFVAQPSRPAPPSGGRSMHSSSGGLG